MAVALETPQLVATKEASLTGIGTSRCPGIEFLGVSVMLLGLMLNIGRASEGAVAALGIAGMSPGVEASTATLCLG